MKPRSNPRDRKFTASAKRIGKTTSRDRDAALRKAREQAEAVIQQAHAELAKELERAKAELDGCVPTAGGRDFAKSDGAWIALRRGREAPIMTRRYAKPRCSLCWEFASPDFPLP